MDVYEHFGQKAFNHGWFGIYRDDGNPNLSYPPLMVWLTRVASWLGGGGNRVAPTDFRTPFTVLMCLCDMGMIVLLLMLGLRRGLKSGLAAAALWAFNPASIYDTGYWIQSNPPLLLALGLCAALGIWKRWFWAGLALGIACLLKPQAWILMPALWLWAEHDAGWKEVWRSIAGVMLPILLVLAGFIAKGKAGEIMGMFTGIALYMPEMSVDANNFWWLVQLINGQPINAQTVVGGMVGVRVIAMIMLAASMTIVVTLWWRNHRRTQGAGGAEMLAITAMLFFLMAAQQHENHAMSVLALTAVAWAAGRKLSWQVGLISAAILVNCMIFDPTLNLFILDGSPSPWTGMQNMEQTTYLIGIVTAMFSVANILLGIWWIKRFVRREA
jgi:hypothetical protein